MKKLLALFISGFLLMGMLYASVGKIVAAKGDITVLRDAKKLKAAAGFELEEKDVVNSIGKSKAQIIFNDKTVITIGKDSEFKIQEYLFEEGKEPKASFGFAKGAFRSITGQIGKVAPDRFKLKTKTATIGIRGTQILARIENGENKIACTDGIISVTSLDTGKTVEVKAGQITMVVPKKPPTRPRAYKPAEIKDMANASGGGGEKMKADEVIIKDNGKTDSKDGAATEDKKDDDEGKAKEEDKTTEEKQATETAATNDQAAADENAIGDMEADTGMGEDTGTVETINTQKTFDSPQIETESIGKNVEVAKDTAEKVNEDIAAGILDKKKPNAPQIINTPLTNDSTPIIKGTGEAGTAIEVTIDDKTYHTVVDGNSNWQIEITDPLQDSAYPITAVSIDTAQNKSAVTQLTITIDTTATAPTIITGTIINESTPIIEGTGEAGSIIELTVDQTTYTTTVGADGKWSIEITSGLTEDTHAISVVSVDAALNKSQAVELGLKVDLTPPAAPGAIDLAASSDRGISSTDNITDQKILLITGSATAGETVTIYSGDTQLGTVIADSTGSWSFTTAELAEGEYLIKAVVSDAAGNRSESDVLKIIIDIARIAQELNEQLLAAEIAQLETKPEVAVGLPGFAEHLNDSKVIFPEDDPYLSWGAWYSSADTVATPENITGGWVAGEMTPSAVIDGYIKNSVTSSYSGGVQGVVKDAAASYSMKNGSVDLAIQYGAANPVTGNIQFDANSEHWNMAVGTSSVFNTGFAGSFSTGAGSAVTINSGDMSGRFYGPNAESIGGQFEAGNGATVEESTKAAHGVFIGSK